MICSFILLKSEIFLISSSNLVERCEVEKNGTKQKNIEILTLDAAFIRVIRENELGISTIDWNIPFENLKCNRSNDTFIVLIF